MTSTTIPAAPFTDDGIPVMSAFVEVRGVSKTFRRPGQADGGVVALSDVSFTLQPGEFVCLLGPSGCGKTTLLRMINGLIEPDDGEILINGQTGPQPGPWAGFVFQS